MLLPDCSPPLLARSRRYCLLNHATPICAKNKGETPRKVRCGESRVGRGGERGADWQPRPGFVAAPPHLPDQGQRRESDGPPAPVLPDPEEDDVEEEGEDHEVEEGGEELGVLELEGDEAKDDGRDRVRLPLAAGDVSDDAAEADGVQELLNHLAGLLRVQVLHS
jgi:hypothetical protein